MGEPDKVEVKVPDPQESSGGMTAGLIALCAGLWVVAAIILWANWPDTKRDYYWGNIMQALETQPPRLDQESVSALAAMGDAIIPSCSYELAHHWNPAFRIAVLKVLEQTEANGARDLLDFAATHDLDARVRGNALLSMRARAHKNAAEAAPLLKVAETIATSKTEGDPDLNVRATAALILAERGNGGDAVKALLVFALRNPFLRKDSATALAKVNPSGPELKPDAPGKEFLDEIMAYEKWCQAHDIALVASPVAAPVTSSAGGDGK